MFFSLLGEKFLAFTLKVLFVPESSGNTSVVYFILGPMNFNKISEKRNPKISVKILKNEIHKSYLSH